jgi:hypothetical protein
MSLNLNITISNKEVYFYPIFESEDSENSFDSYLTEGSNSSLEAEVEVEVDSNSHNNNNNNNTKLIKPIKTNYNNITNYSNGFTTSITKENNFISRLIQKRITSCVIGPSSHIAAFLQNHIDIGSCFLSCWKRKGRNR